MNDDSKTHFDKRPLPAGATGRSLLLAAGVLLANPLAWAQASQARTGSAAAAPILAETVVTGARSERALEDVPASIDLLEGDALDPARVQDIRDLVRDLPNVSVRRAPQRFGGVLGSTGRDGNAGFNIRGLEGNRVLLTVDGVRMPRSYGFGPAAFGRDYFDLGLISRVELVRGASSALHGSDGLAGMVAMFTTEPKDLLQPGQTLGGRALASHASEDGMSRVGATLAGQASESLQWLLGAHTARSHELDNMGGNTEQNFRRTAPNPQQDRQSAVLGKLVLKPGAAWQHTFTLEHMDRSSEVEAYSGRGPTIIAGRTLWNVTDLDGSTELSRSRLSWEGRWRLGQPWADHVRATLAWQEAESRAVTFERRNTLAGVALPLRSRDQTYTERLLQLALQAEKSTPLGAHWNNKLVYGLDLSSTDMSDLTTGLAPPAGETFPLKRFPDSTERLSALFVQSELLSERWSVIPALRYDQVSLKASASPLYMNNRVPASLSENAVSPKLGVIFRPAPGWSVYGNLAAAFRAPSPHQLNSFFENLTSPSPYRTIPNPDLRPESGRTLELGLRQRGRTLSWDAAVFAGRYQDFIEENVRVGGAGTRASPTEFQSVNRARVRLSGFELKGKLALSPATDLRLAYGQTQGRDSVAKQPLNSVNPAQLVLGLEHRTGPWQLGATLTHTARKRVEDIAQPAAAVPPGQAASAPFAPPAYTTLGLTAAWQMRPGLRLSAAVHNLSDRKYWEWANVRGIAANSPVLDAFTAPGRNFTVALSADF
ncbi:TonB-dependent hemoglobin/transferrin/lactoferrin family receptor [Hydrogenophaga sp.]|uniref:TonB-dependent hemoglobin/transferrin/lactoferrin family receptor n=1 Tax=Hydrogenophaga sp. TaxID=1904254 RepID=UPI0025BDCB87|nr:TonB-dependent hemoglobin/transferrin/lactoferrin family receptor [Hydrogenophaga sp.]